MFRKGRWVAVLGAAAVLALAAVAGCQASRLLRQPHHEPAVHAVTPAEENSHVL